MNNKRTNDLGNDRIFPLLMRLALPSVVAQLVNALYNIVDRIYIGRIAGTGGLALTGVGVTFPVLMLVSAISSLIGMGGGARTAIHLGEGNEEKAQKILGNCAGSLIIASVILTAVFQIFKEPLLMLFGASSDTIEYGLSYLGIYLWGTIFVTISLGLNYFISTQGFSTISMTTVLIGAVINIILDPIFIFVFDMGVKGAALATVISQGASATWVVLFLTGKRTRLKIKPANLLPRASIMLPVLAIGISPFIMQSTESLLSIAFNSSLQKYGGDIAVGSMTIASSVLQVFCITFSGFAQGAQPIIGFNYGAGKADRVKAAFKLLFSISVSLSVMWFIVIQLFPGFFVGLFNDDPELTASAIRFIRIYMGGTFIMGVQFSCQQSFVALGQAKISLCLALLRKIVLLIPLIYILPVFISDKVFAVFLAEPVADIAAALTTGTLFFTKLPKILDKRLTELRQG